MKYPKILNISGYNFIKKLVLTIHICAINFHIQYCIIPYMTFNNRKCDYTEYLHSLTHLLLSNHKCQ